MTKLTQEKVRSEIEDIARGGGWTGTWGRHEASSELSKKTGLSLGDSFRLVVDFQMRNMSGADTKIYKKFTIRLANCLCNMNLWSVADIRRKILDGSLHPKAKGCRNYGWKSHNLLLDLVGLPGRGKSFAKMQIRCPCCGEKFPVAGNLIPVVSASGAVNSSPGSSTGSPPSSKRG